MREVDRVASRVRSLLGDETAESALTGDSSVAPPQAPGRAAGWRQRLGARFAVRVDPGRRPALAVGVAVLVAALVTGAWVLAQRPQAAPVSAQAPSLAVTATPSGTGAPAGAAGASVSPSVSPSVASASVSASLSASVVVVDVAGRVRRPGLYRLPAGSRIDDAVRAAGGALPRVDLSSLNLAASLVDGQQIRVGLRGVAPVGDPAAVPGAAGTVAGAPGAGTSGSATPGAPVDLNTATLEQLDTLPGVGPVLAQHIVDWRGQHTSFTSVSQLNDVSGIGEVKFAELRPLVTV